jgi:hypothetical protein
MDQINQTNLKSLISNLNYNYTHQYSPKNRIITETNQKSIPQILNIINRYSDTDFYIITKNNIDLKCFTKDEILNIIPESIIDKILLNKPFFQTNDFKNKISNLDKFGLINLYYDIVANNFSIISISLLKTFAFFQSDPILDDFINNL